MTYMRQLYKQQLQNAVPMWRSESSLSSGFKRGKFEGVEGEAHMRGELFGIENLFQFSTSSILQSLRTKYSERKARGSGICDERYRPDSIPGIQGMSKGDVDETMNLLANDLKMDAGPSIGNTSDLNTSSSGLALLQSMGINIQVRFQKTKLFILSWIIFIVLRMHTGWMKYWMTSLTMM